MGMYKMLIVESDLELLDKLESYFSNYDDGICYSYDVKTATSQEKALELMNHQHPDVIIVDEDDDSHEIFVHMRRILKSQNRFIPIIQLLNNYHDMIGDPIGPDPSVLKRAKIEKVQKKVEEMIEFSRSFIYKRAANILIVESEPNTLTMLQDEFQQEGYQVQIASTGNAVFEQIKQTIPDVIVMEADLPDINGFEMRDQLRELACMKKIPIIFMLDNDSELSKILRGRAMYKPKHKMFIIEPDPDITNMLDNYFTELGYEVQIVSERDNLIATIEQSQPDIVIMGFDNREDYYATIDEFHKNPKTKNIPSVSYMPSHDKSIGMADWADGFNRIYDSLTVPFDIEELGLRVKHVIWEAQSKHD